MPNKEYIIIAPHADDEIIGCYEVLKTGKVATVYFPTREAVAESMTSALTYGFEPKIISISKGISVKILNEVTFLFGPDPNYDFHPEHRFWGHVVERAAREQKLNVCFYNTNMNAPYIREVKDQQGKQKALDICYSQKADLWRFDHRYFLFEGQTQWRMSWEN